MKQKHLIHICLILAVLAGVISACQPIDINNNADDNIDQKGGKPEVLKSDKPRAVVDRYQPEETKSLVVNNNQFAFDLYKQLLTKDGNIVFSPFSISMALTMAYGGARGGTAEQMVNVLHLSQPDQVHAAYNWLDQELEKRAIGPEMKNDSGFELSIANSIWGQQGFNFNNEYLDLLAAYYGTGLNTVDFSADPEGGRKAVNDWVSDETNKKIQDLLPQGSVTTDTRMILANAIYFYAPWKDEFDKKKTINAPFMLLDNTQVAVPMMSAKHSYGYSVGPGYQVVELPYRGDQVAMVLIVPDPGNYQAFEDQLSSELFSQVLQGIAYDEVTLTFPKFTFDSEFGLSETLKSLGMTDAFDSQNADFSGINGERNLVITDVVHKAVIDVNEKGTEAAAATGIIVGLTSMREEKIVVVDRPFIYAIYDKPTGSILFMGRVLNPAN